LASCSSVKFLEGTAQEEPPPDVDEVLANMDEGMRRISEWNPVDDFMGSAGDCPKRAEANRVARNAVKSLYVTAMFNDLPVDSQLQPSVQKRIQSALPEIDASAKEMDSYLDANFQVSDEEMQACLSRDDDPGMRFLQQFNDLAGAHGVTARRRLQVRAMTTNILWRLKNQPPELLINECNDKMERATTSAGPEAAARRLLASRVTEEAFWSWQQQQEGEPEDLSEYSGWSAEPNEDSGELEDGEEKKKDERSLATRGARMMGIGLLIFGVGAALAVGGAWPGVIAGTVGAIYFLIGLIKVIVGSIRGDGHDSDNDEEG